MIVPDFWAEARRQHRANCKQVTVRRFGWSNDSAEAAQVMAEQRVEAALAAVLDGQKVLRREPRIAYNGAAGVPIREEVLARQGEDVITRNGYGARCLNSPRLLMADVDAEPAHDVGLALLVFLVLGGALLYFGAGRVNVFALTGVLFAVLVGAAPLARRLRRRWLGLRGGPEQVCRQRLNAFLASHPDWQVRRYRTPAGQRLLVTHCAFRSDDPLVAAFFQAVGADPVYVRMCFNQRCFRARLSAKPWRIGIGDHLRPRPGVWPVRPEQRAVRAAWVARYEQAANGFAACHFAESSGSGAADPALAEVVDLHDRCCHALRTTLPLA